MLDVEPELFHYVTHQWAQQSPSTD